MCANLFLKSCQLSRKTLDPQGGLPQLLSGQVARRFVHVSRAMQLFQLEMSRRWFQTQTQKVTASHHPLKQEMSPI